MIYDFESLTTGEVRGIAWDPDDPALPLTGDVIEHEGDRWRKLPPQGRISLRTPGSTHFVDDVGQLPYNWEAHKRAGGTFDSEGRCQFGSSSQVRKTMDTAKAMGEPVRYTGATVKPLVDPAPFKRARKGARAGH